MYDKVLNEIDWIIPQKVPQNATSTYWTYAIKYLGHDKIGVSWEDLPKVY